MATSIVWTDEFGSVELTNGMPAPGDRFSGWKPLVPDKGTGARVVATALGTGITYAWNHRRNFGASFTLGYIPNTDQDVCARLKDHLEGGGSIVLHTGDAEGNTYDCHIWPGTEVSIGGPDKQDKRYTVTLSVLNDTASEIMVCRYP